MGAGESKVCLCVCVCVCVCAQVIVRFAAVPIVLLVIASVLGVREVFMASGHAIA